MRLKKLGCKYFMHYGEWQEINFSDEHSIVSIIGNWANDPKRSNRSGKSTLVEAILYGLYGKSRSKKEIDLINKHFSGEDMVVELTFDNNGEEIVIQRGRSSSNQIILELTDFEGADKKIVQDEINRLVGLSYDDFIMTSFFLQGDIHTFMEAGATGQKQMIAKWLEKDYWKVYEKKAKEQASDLAKQVDRLELIAENKPDPLEDAQIINHINILDDKKKSIETQLEALGNKAEVIKNQLVELDNLEEHENEIIELNKQIKRFETNIKANQDTIKDLEKQLPEAEKVQKSIELLPEFRLDRDDLGELVLRLKTKYDKKAKEAAEADAEVKSLRKQFAEIKNFDNVCPVMMKPCAAIDSVNDSKEELKLNGKEAANKAGELNLRSSEIKKDLDSMIQKLDKAREKVREIEIIERGFISPTVMQDKILNLKDSNWDYEKEILRLQHKVHISKRKIEEFAQIDKNLLKSQKVEINNEISVKKNETSDIINLVASLNAKVEQNQLQRQKAAEAEKEIKKVSKSLNLYKYVAYMFSKNGIPSNQVEVAFNEIEEEANIILEKINSDMVIEFSAEREMNSWEENCLVCGFTFPKGFRKQECPECSTERQKKRKDELSIKIITKGEEIDFNLESGGGKVLISLAIRLAFVRMLQRRLGVNLKLIVFDEIFGMLDGMNRGYVLKLLADTLIHDFGFSQIFVISHEEEIRDVIPHVIKVTKYDQHSEFEWS